MPYEQNAWLSLSAFPETSQNIYFAVDWPYIDKRTSRDVTLIGLQAEPDAILHLRQMFIDNHKNFEVILTHDDEILKACPNARLYVWGTTWISPSVYNSIDISRKQPKVSCLTGTKNHTDGHRFRLDIYRNQKRIQAPITWFRSSKDNPILPSIVLDNPLLRQGKESNPVLRGGKEGLFLDYQYAVVIENTRQNNYFTEKLMDCLLTKTIPIYYGCPNISNWFDTRGWIILDTTSANDFNAKCRHLPPYNMFLPVIEANHERAKQYTSIETNIQRVMNFGN
jgi:hypothetical protein